MSGILGIGAGAIMANAVFTAPVGIRTYLTIPSAVKAGGGFWPVWQSNGSTLIHVPAGTAATFRVLFPEGTNLECDVSLAGFTYPATAG